ncbi:MAG: hypothetical protein ABSG53_16430 [Thermoguttaceae bacterium]|jgi:hypothetical protein
MSAALENLVPMASAQILRHSRPVRGASNQTWVFDNSAPQVTGAPGSPSTTTTINIGSDTGTPVDDKDYQVPIKFTGKIDKLTVAIEPPKLTPEDGKKLMEAGVKAADGAEPPPKHLQPGPG